MNYSARINSRRPVPTGGVTGVVLLLLVIAGGGAAYYWFGNDPQNQTQFVMPGEKELWTVVPRSFEHSLNEPGEIESSNNTEIRCEVQSRNSSGIMILEIVPNGATVKPGDFLVRFDSSALENERNQQQIMCNNSEAAVAQSKAAYETALITKQEYLEGTFKQEEQAIQSEVFVAEENLRRAQEYARYSERLAARGYVTAVQVEADRFAVEKARKELETAQTKLMVLREFTKAKMLKTLDANIESALAKRKADENTNKLDVAKLELIQGQIDKCRVVSPVSGKVVYANVQGYRGNNEVLIQEGALVRERQSVLRIPDMGRMQVMAKINETRIGYVRPNMKATVRLESFPDLALAGTVTRVDEYPIPNSIFSTQVKQYATYVEIDNPPAGMIRPGLTAKVEIRVDQVDNALVVPIQAVIEKGGEFYCLSKVGDKLVAQWVAVGAQNEKEVVIREGLADGSTVLLNPDPYLEGLDFPQPPPGKSNAELARRFANQSGKTAKAGPPGKGPAGKGAPGKSSVDLTAMVQGIFDKYDTNRDSILSADEIPVEQRERMTRADGDRDGRILRAELMQSLSNTRSGTETAQADPEPGAAQ